MDLNLSNAIDAAKQLLGWELISQTPAGITSGYIVETEAYTMSDAASHSYHGKTSRNWPMFESAGTVYVYIIYGMYNCFNIACGTVDDGQAVLIRALQPTGGQALMMQRRQMTNRKLLTNGPAKLTQALSITRNLNGINITETNPYLHLKIGFRPTKIVAAKRIGIAKATNRLWRFYVSANPYVSTL